MQKNYRCGCGKSYGSYPAFSTHKKYKHNNQTIQGTQIPSQQKSKRGRPTYNFKKIPEILTSKKKQLNGLNVIQLGLLDLEEKYKGKIINTPEQNNYNNLDDLASHQSNFQSRINVISKFIQLLTDHMKKQSSFYVINFVKNMIKYGIQTSKLLSVQLYNEYCIKNLKQLSTSEMGLNFFIDICLMLSKWLCVMGYSTEIIKIKQKTNLVPNENHLIKS